MEALGAARLAAILVELGDSDAGIKRRLRMELAGAESLGDLVQEIRKRLATIERSRGRLDWRNRKTVLDDLEMQRRLIAEQVVKRAPAEALELMWRFVEMAEAVIGRCEDVSGSIVGVFQTAVEDLGKIAARARHDPVQLADRTFAALSHNGYGQIDGLIASIKDGLGPAGLEHLKQRIKAFAAAVPSTENRRLIGHTAAGPVYAPSAQDMMRNNSIRHFLQAIADAQGDVDGFVAQYDNEARSSPRIAIGIARRLLAAGRAADAWTAIQAAKPERNEALDFVLPQLDWEDVRIDVLESLGRGEDAQAARLACFERSFSERHLRDYLKRLPDFDDFDAEQCALAGAEASSNFLQALGFLVKWPALDRAARLVANRGDAIDGNDYDFLTPASEALAGKHPLAATLLVRAMIDFALKEARSNRYGYAARHLQTCAGLAGAITDWGDAETHETYVDRLRREHGRKAGFWSRVT